MTSEYHPEDRANSSIPDAGNNPQDTTHLSDVPYDNTPIAAVLNENTPVDSDQLKALQDGTYWSERAPAKEPALRQLPPAQEKSRHLGRNITIGLAAASVAVGSWFGIHAASEGNKTETLPPEPTPNASAPVTPGGQESTAPTPEVTPELTFEQKVAQHRIEEGQSEENLSTNIMKELNGWVMSGVDDKTATFKAFAEAGYSSASDTPKYAAEVAKLNAPVFAAALFGEDWASNPAAGEFVQIQTKLNAMYIDYHIATADSGEPFKISNDITSHELRFGTTTEGNISINTVVNADIASRNAGYIQVENGLKQTYNTDIKPNPNVPGSIVLSGTSITNVR